MVGWPRTRGRTSVEGVVHPLHELVDCDTAVAVCIEVLAVRHRSELERDVDAQNELVDPNLAVIVAVADALGQRSMCDANDADEDQRERVDPEGRS